MAAVAYYTPAYVVVSKLWILPTSLFMTLFPAFSTLGIAHKEDLERLFTQSSKHLMLATGPIVLVLILFAEDILHLWLGSEFADKSTLAFQILVVGFFFNCQAWIPSTLLLGIGRPDIVGKLFLCELPLFMGLLWWLIGKMGIEGAALAWALRGILEMVLFYVSSWKIVKYDFSSFVENGTIKGAAALGGLTVALTLVKAAVGENWLTQSLLTIVFLVLFGFIAWRFVIGFNEKGLVMRFIKILSLRSQG
jgi:O-antigen/teichoic acid export membrane protein